MRVSNYKLENAFSRFTCNWEDTIKVDLKEIENNYLY
jgi:hypothetical protein